MCTEFDLTYNDFNPTVFYVSKFRVESESDYHDHDHTELAYILSGKGRYLVNGNEFDVDTGDLIICNPGVKHKQLLTNPKEPSMKFITGFTNYHFKDMPANSLLLKNGGCILHTTAELRQELYKHCYAMLTEEENNQVGRYFMLKTHLMQMLLLIMREIADVEKTEQKGCSFETYNKIYAVNRIINYLNENYNHKISLEKIAHNMYLSPVYISKIFKEETGESPINYLIKIRLEKAKEILQTNDAGSIKDIASQVGYDDVYHFSKLFKKYYGISPLYYRKKTTVQDASNQ